MYLIKIKNILSVLFITQTIISVFGSKPYLTVIGEMNYWGSLTRASIGAIDILYKDFPINFIRTPRGDIAKINFKDISGHVKKIVKKSSKKYGKLILLCETLNNSSVIKEVKKLPKDSLKIAISVTEFSKISAKWVKIYNKYFDAILVADQFLIEIYKKSGINIPVFLFPNGTYTKGFLQAPVRYYTGEKPFTFGVSSTFIPRKNNEMLVMAFIKAFGNNPKFRLKICGRYGHTDSVNKIIKKAQVNNISIIQKQLSQADYIKFMSSLDCYVSLSKGEGFSITPREAMLMKKPCILSNNTGHKTICDTGFVKVVESNKAEVVDGNNGICYNCDIKDAIAALKDVYNNYSKYLLLTEEAKQWALQFDYYKQKNLYLGFIKPDKIIFSDKNVIKHNLIETNSRELYDKYNNLARS